MERGSPRCNDDNARLERKRMVTKRRLMQRRNDDGPASHDEQDDDDDDNVELHDSSFLPDWSSSDLQGSSSFFPDWNAAASSVEDDSQASASESDYSEYDELVSESETETETGDDPLSPGGAAATASTKPRRPRSKRIARGASRREGGERRKVKDKSLSKHHARRTARIQKQHTPVRTNSSRSMSQQPERQASDRSLGGQSNHRSNNDGMTGPLEKRLSARKLVDNSLSSSAHNSSTSLKMTPKVTGGRGSESEDRKRISSIRSRFEQNAASQHQCDLVRHTSSKKSHGRRSAGGSSPSKHTRGGGKTSLLSNSSHHGKEEEEDEQFWFIE